MQFKFYPLLLLLVPSWVRGQMGLQVDKPRLYFTEQSGPIAPVRVMVKNPSPVRMIIRASCSDWRRDSLGNKQYLKSGTLPTSCCPYLQVEPETIELPPGGQQGIRVALKPPPGLQPHRAHNGMLLLTQINEQEVAATQQRKTQFIYKVQLGVHLYYLPTRATEKNVEIDTLALREFQPTARLGVRVSNTGSLPLDSRLRLELTNQETAEEIKLPAVPVNTLPGDRIWVLTSLPDKLVKGRYLVIAILESGADVPLEVADQEIQL